MQSEKIALILYCFCAKFTTHQPLPVTFNIVMTGEHLSFASESYLLLKLDLNVILSLVISKISFIPKYFGDKINIKIYSSASLIDPCYLRSNKWLSPLADFAQPRLQEETYVSSPLWRTLAPHSCAGVLSGRQVLPHMMVVS